MGTDVNPHILRQFSHCPHMLDLTKTYHSELPEELRWWYCYIQDCGHSILCILSQDYEPDDKAFRPTDHLVAVSVKTVIRNYEIRGQERFVIVNNVQYDDELGIQVAEEDYEF